MPDDKTSQKDFDILFSQPSNLFRTMLERTWFRNILYYIGEQWIVWGHGNTFEYMYSLSSGVPTPVSDIIKDHVRAMKALIMNKKFRIGVVPNSMEFKDRDSAKLATKLADNLYRRDDFAEKDEQELCAMMMVLTGNGFVRTHPNPNSGKYVLDRSGKPVIDKGEIETSSLMPFQVFVPDAGSNLRKKACVGVRTLADREWVEDTYKVKIQTSEDQRRLTDYQRQLAVLVANVSPWKGTGLQTSPSFNDDSVVIEEIEYRPTLALPKGRYVGRCAGQDLFDEEELPIRVGKDGSWEYSVTHFPYNYTPGSFWASGSVDALISPQDTINRIDQAIENNRETLGRPYVMTPAELTLKRLSSRGSRLLALQYDGRSAGGAKPEIRQGVPMPDQIFTDRGNRLHAAQTASGDPKNVLQGGSPFAGAAGIAIDTLRESAELSHTPDVDRYYRRWGGVKRKQLIIAQYLYSEARLIKVPGKGNDVYIRNFKGSDLHNNTDVVIDIINGLASTPSGQTSIVMDSIQYGLWNDEMVRPDLRREVLKLLGVGDIQEITNIHMERAEYENSLLVESDTPENMALPIEGGEEVQVGGGRTVNPNQFEGVDPVFRLDNHSIHIQSHDKLIFSREFLTLSKVRQKNIIGHRDLHAALLSNQQVAQSEIDAESEAMAGAMKGGMNKTSVEEKYGAR